MKLVPTYEVAARDPNHRLVGARSKTSDYVGPVAHVHFDKEWLYITTDDYEGSAMLNIEALPALMKALRLVCAAVRQPK